VSTKSVRTSKSAPTTPTGATLQITTADELLLARMQTLVAFAIVLACEGFTTDRANERSFVCVCAKMRAKVVCSSETLGTQVTLECSRVLLLPATIRTIGGRAFRVGKVKDVISLVRSVARATAVP
jgi:hypothetical protein